MIAEHKIKTGDLLPPVRGTCLDGNGKPQPLTGGTVRFHMFDSRGNVLIDAPAVVVDALAGKVQYNWQPGQTDVAGIYKCEFEVTFGGTMPLTFPNDGYGRITITKQGA
jgi:hypothetical protein